MLYINWRGKHAIYKLEETLLLEITKQKFYNIGAKFFLKRNMGVIIRYLLIMVTIAISLTSVECTVTGLATFYDPPYVREYIYMYINLVH